MAPSALASLGLASGDPEDGAEPGAGVFDPAGGADDGTAPYYLGDMEEPDGEEGHEGFEPSGEF